MKKLFLAVLLGALATSTFAANDWSTNQYQQGNYIPSKSLSVEYSTHKGKFGDNIDADLDGFAIGFSSNPVRSGWWTEFEYLKNDDFDADYYEVSLGGQYNLINANNFYAVGKAGLGFGWSKVDLFDNTQFVTLPIEFEGGFNFTPNFAIYGGVGYKWAWDVSNETTCRDGSTSNSTGQGACSWHGGISYYNYTIGDFDGVTYKAGLRYNF